MTVYMFALMTALNGDNEPTFGAAVDFTVPALNTEVGPIWSGDALYMVYVN